MFKLPVPDQIRGDQLAAEINAATGLSLTVYDVGFYPPDQVEISAPYTPEQAPVIQSVINAHVPQAVYTPEERTAADSRSIVVNLATSAVGLDVSKLSAAQQLALLSCLLYQAKALTDTGKIRPLNEWL